MDGGDFQMAVKVKERPVMLASSLPSAIASRGGRFRSVPSAESRAADAALWREYRRHRTIELRNTLVERYIDLARMTAERERTRLPAEVDTEDLRQAASIALVRAVEKFDPKLNFKFETFCSLHLRGGMIDQLRAMDWVPRLVRHRSSRLDRARASLEANLGRIPTDDEVRQRLGVGEREFRKLRRDSAPPSMVSLDRPCFEGDSSRALREIDIVADGRAGRPEVDAMRRDLLNRIGRGLSRSERLVIALYYFEQMTMREIGEVLDLSESRVSQMHTLIIKRLKGQAGELRLDLAR